MTTANAMNNVVTMNPKRVYTSILSHLSSSKKSKNTFTAYHNDLSQFFKTTRKTKIEDLVESQLWYNAEEVDAYQTLLTKTMKNTSVNRKMEAIAGLFKSLDRYKYNVDLAAMKVDPLPNDSEAHGFLLFDETEEMAEIVLKHKNGFEKSLLIKLAVRTSLRKCDLLSLTYDMIYPDSEKVGDYLFDIEEEKTKKIVTKELSGELHNQLLELRNYIHEDNKIFHITLDMIETMMKNLCLEMGIDKRRRVTFHSFRKAGGGFLKEQGYSDSDIADQLGHASVETSRKWYLKKGRNLAGRLMDEKIDKDIFEQLSKEEMLELLMGVENGMGAQLRRKAKVIINER